MTKYLWFDDGKAEDWTIARESIKGFQGLGILAIITSRVGKPGYLTISQLRTMIGEGWEIASHSTNHKNFTEMSSDEIADELVKSKQWIIENLHIDPVAFVAPWDLLKKEHVPLVLKHYKMFREPHTTHFHSAAILKGRKFYREALDRFLEED